MTIPGPKGNNYRIAFAAISGKSGGAGHVTRALAIRNALIRLGYKLDGTDGLEFWLTGSVDDEDKWNRLADPDFAYVHPDGVPAYPTLELIETRKHEICWMLDKIAPDLLLVDNSFHYVQYILSGLYGYTRPPAVWGIARYYPQAYMGVDAGSLDRLYQIEAFYPAFYNPGIATNRTRSKAEKEGGAHEEYVPSFDNNDPDYTSGRAYQKWQERHGKYDRKLLAPVVNVDPRLVLGRDAAADKLIELLPLDERPSLEDRQLIRERRKKLVLVTGRPGAAAEQIDQDRYEKFVSEELKKYANPVVIQLGMSKQPVDNLYTMLPGADVVIATCGYNLFYEIRYLRQLGLFTGQTHYFALTERIHDQSTRLHFSNDWGGASVYPLGNGADRLALEILISAGKIDNSERDLRYPHLPRL